MDIFGSDRDAKLTIYKNTPLLFTVMENSTCTAEGVLRNVEHDESELTTILKCSGNIIAIDSNYGHLRPVDYEEAEEVKKSKRGRKKKIKPKKVRKFQGDGSGFNSQISFSILGTHIRPVPIIPDKHSVDSIKLPNNHESITKKYKIKLFRNGRFTIPGILTESMVDVKAPLTELCDYLTDYFLEDVAIDKLYSVMRNYKLHLLEGRIDISQLQRHCNQTFQKLLNTRFSDISDFIITPVFLKSKTNPYYDGWNSYFDNNLNEQNIDYQQMKTLLKESINTKNLYIDPVKLIEKINEMNLPATYRKLQILHEVLNQNLCDEVLQAILKYWLTSKLCALEKFLVKSKDNILSYFKYDPEKYPGFLIKVRTPNQFTTSKKTTIKIFPSGKINIDGANSREEAEFIYYWLNHLFATNKNIIYRVDQIYDETDSEFSEDSDLEDI